MEEKDLLKKWLNGNLTDEEFKKLSKSEDFQLISKIDNSLANFKAPDFNSELNTNDYQLKSDSVKRKIEVNFFLKVAAILILISFPVFLYVSKFSSVNIEVLSDHQELLYLPDSSKVTLNAKSSVNFIKNNWPTNRKVELLGEGFFQVVKGANFEVITDLGIVKVLGTEFNVISRGDFFEVTCFSGKVKVSAFEKEEILLPNESFRIYNGDDSRVELSNDEIIAPSWMSGKSSFKSVPFKLVLEEFERQYNVSLQAKEIDTQKLFSGSFTHHNRDVALKSITIPLNCSYSIVNGKIILSNNKVP